MSPASTSTRQLLYYWVLHSDQTISYSKEGFLLLTEISKWLLAELSKTSDDELLLSIAIEGWRLFQLTSESQLAWIQFFLQQDNPNFFIRFLEDFSSVQKDFFLKESVIIDEVAEKVVIIFLSFLLFQKNLTVTSDINSLFPKTFHKAN